MVVVRSVSDRDRIRIQSAQWIRIRNPDPDPDPGGQKIIHKKKYIFFLKCWMFSFEGLKGLSHEIDFDNIAKN